MSEKTNPELDQAIDQNVEDDPLAELARIVAGEPEPVLESPVLETSESALDTFERPEELSVTEMDMEAALAAALDETSPEAEDLRGSIEPESEISAREEITRAVDQVINEEPIDYAEPEQEPFVQEPHVAPQEPPAEMSFEDGLISALESELVPAQPEPAPLMEEVLETQTPVEEIVYEDPVSSPEFASLENALAAELQDELATEPAAQVAFEAPIEETLIEETFAPEPVMDAPVLANELMPELPVAVEEPVAIDEDLGAAFANEFEQMLSEENPDAGVGQEIAVDAPQSEEAFAEEIAAPLDMQPQVEAPRSLDELDFGAAFADELGVDKVEEVSGWETGGTEAAQVEFSEALQPQENAPAVGHHDPGHSGEIPEVPSEAMMQPEIAAEQGERSSPKYALAALIIALFAGTIFAGYGFLGGDGAAVNGEPTLIKADTDPIKEKPEDPGGRVVANQDKASYERVEGNDGDTVQQESLISKTEEPAEIVSTGVDDGAVTETNLTPKTDDRLSGSQEDTTQNGTTLAGEVTPRVVQTVTVKPDGTIVTTTPSVPKVAEPVTSTTTELASNAVTPVQDATTNLTETLRVEPKPVVTEIIKRPEAIDGARTTGNTAIPVASPLPKPVVKQKPKPVQTAAVKPAQPAAPAAVRRSEWVVQVSSQRTPEAAQSSFTNLRNRFGVLQGRPMSVQRANVNGSTFYRVRVQTSSKSDANQLCNSLKSAGGSCFVTR